MVTKKFGSILVVVLIVMVGGSMAINATGSETDPDRRSFIDEFEGTKSVAEKHPMSESPTQHWWVSSGGYAYWENGQGRTEMGNVPQPNPDPRLASYQPKSNTDYGQHPQNIFRMVQRQSWLNYRQTMYFSIARYINSPDLSRTKHNGLLLFNRYLDSDNLYYTGIRVDGSAVIKKKVGGVYTTLATVPMLPGAWDRASNPNLIPEGVWLGVRSEVVNVDGGVSIKLFVDMERSGEWRLVAQAIDDGSAGGPPLISEGFGGIRTDFMDVYFDDYEMTEL